MSLNEYYLVFFVLQNFWVKEAVQEFIFPNTIDARFITIDDGDGPRYPKVEVQAEDDTITLVAGDFKFFGSFTNRESFSSNRDDKRLLTTDPFTDRDGDGFISIGKYII